MPDIVITYRFRGVDVSPDAVDIDYVQMDSNIGSIFDPVSSTMDVVWSGIPTHYNPEIGFPAPNVFVVSSPYPGSRMFVQHLSGGSIDWHHLKVTTTQGDLYVSGDGSTAIVVSIIDHSFDLPDMAMTLESGYVGPVAEMTLVATAGFTLGGRGLVIDVPDAGRWQLQKVSLRPRQEEEQ